MFQFISAIMLQLRISGGYFLSDTLVLLSFPKGYLLAIDDKKDDPPQGRPFQFIAHHVVCIICIALVLHTKVAIWFMAWRLLTEVPNIFLNLLLILDLYKPGFNLTIQSVQNFLKNRSSGFLLF